MFIYQLKLYWMVHHLAFPDNRTKVVMAASYCRGLSQDTVNLLTPANFILQLQTMFGEIDPKQEAEGKLLRLKLTSNILSYVAAFISLKVQYAWGDKAYAA